MKLKIGDGGDSPIQLYTHFDRGGDFFKGSKKHFGYFAEVGVVTIVWLQRLARCWPKYIKALQNNIWVLYIPFSKMQVS